MGVVQDLFARLLQTELQRSCLPVSVLEEVAGQVQDEDDEAGEVRGVGWSSVGWVGGVRWWCSCVHCAVLGVVGSYSVWRSSEHLADMLLTCSNITLTSPWYLS